MKIKYLFFFALFFLFSASAVYAQKTGKSLSLYPEVGKGANEDSGNPFEVPINEYNAYISAGDRWTPASQDDSEELAIKNPDKVSPYVEVGLHKKY